MSDGAAAVVVTSDAKAAHGAEGRKLASWPANAGVKPEEFGIVPWPRFRKPCNSLDCR
jgi:hypothetical protein